MVERKIPIKQVCTCGKRSEKIKCACRWEYRYREPGTGKQREPRFDTYDEAYAAFLKIEQSKRDGTYISPVNSGRLFKDVFEEWKTHGSVPLADVTYENYDSIYRNHFGPMFGHRKIGSIGPDDIKAFQDDQKARGYSRYGSENRMNLLATVFNYAVRREWIGRNPCHAFITSRSGDAYEPVREDQIPTDGEVLRIISLLPAHFRLAGWFMAYCGLRPREALAVCLDSLDRETALLYVNHQIEKSSKYGVVEGDSVRSTAAASGRRGGKGVKPTKHRRDHESRYVPLTPGMIEQIEIHLQTFTPWGEEGWLFESPRYDFQFPSYAIFLKAFKSASEEVCGAERNIVPKSFRHYFVSMCLGEGIGLFDIAQWVGHNDTSTTEKVYAHLLAKSARKTRTALGTRMSANIAELADASAKDGRDKLKEWGVKTTRDRKTAGLRDYQAGKIIPNAAKAPSARTRPVTPKQPIDAEAKARQMRGLRRGTQSAPAELPEG